MFFILVKILSKLVYPVGMFFAMILSGLVLMKSKRPRRKLWGKRLVIFAVLTLYLFSNSWVAKQLGSHLEWRIEGPDPWVKADGVVILGGGVEPELKPRRNPELNFAGDRIMRGAQLILEGYADWVICSGGNTRIAGSNQKEADSIKEILQMLGIESDAIIPESKARNTFENAKFSLELIQELRPDSIYLVTSSWHMQRSMAVFNKEAKKLGLDDLKIIPAPCNYFTVQTETSPSWYFDFSQIIVPDARFLEYNTRLMHELYGVLYYKLRGWI